MRQNTSARGQNKWGRRHKGKGSLYYKKKMRRRKPRAKEDMRGSGLRSARVSPLVNAPMPTLTLLRMQYLDKRDDEDEGGAGREHARAHKRVLAVRSD
jgi:hypothetical protein